MILTVTPNTAIGRTLFVAALTPNRRIDVAHRVLTVSGKGVDVSLVLHALGVPTLALGFNAGEMGRLHERMVRERNVEADWVWVGGETRMNVVVIGEQDGTQTTLSDDTLIVTPDDERELIARFERHLTRAAYAALGGPLPRTASQDLYTRLITAAKGQQVPVILDAIGPAVHAWLRAGPAWIKPNRAEMEILIGRSLESVADALAGAQDLHRRYGVNVLVSCDAEGAVAVADGRTWRVRAVDVPVVSAEGAGDAMVAGLAAALAERKSVEEALWLSAAAAAAALLQAGVGECDRRDVERLLPQIVIERL